MNKNEVDIKCPFFLSETDNSLSCESMVDQVKNVMRFPNTESKTAYIEKHCRYYPNQCHICESTLRKYQ